VERADSGELQRAVNALVNRAADYYAQPNHQAPLGYEFVKTEASSFTEAVAESSSLFGIRVRW
jgi:hypothetical protein